MTLFYIDPELGTVPLKSRTISDEHIGAHDVAALPGTVEVDIGQSRGYLATLAGAVAVGRMAVDLSSAVIAYLANLPTLVTRLDSILTAQGAPAALYGGRTIVATAGTRVVLGASQALTEGVELRGLDANVGLVYPGNSTVTSTTNGTRLTAKERVFIRCNNVNKVYIDAQTNGEGVSWIGW